MINLCKSDQNYTERDIVFTLLSKNGFVSSCYFTFILKKRDQILARHFTYFFLCCFYKWNENKKQNGQNKKQFFSPFNFTSQDKWYKINVNKNVQKYKFD